MQPHSPLLQVTGVEARIDDSAVLRGIDFEVRPDSVFCLMGRNGVGKTSTLRSITGLLPVRRGTIRFEGRPIHRLRPEQRARLGLGYVPQGREIFPMLTVEENLRIAGVARGRGIGDDLDRVYTLFPVLREFLPRKGGNLSGGQQQQLAIARALLTRPKLLILDEPTEGIQPNIIDQIGDAIALLRREGGMSILLVEQYLDFCQELGDDFAIIERGKVVANGPMESLGKDLVRTYLTV